MDDDTGIAMQAKLPTYSAIERVQQGMPGSVGNTASSMRLAAFAIIQALSAKSSLINLAIIQPTEWHAIVFQLNAKSSGFNGHNMYKSFKISYSHFVHTRQQNGASASLIYCSLYILRTLRACTTRSAVCCTSMTAFGASSHMY